MEVDGPGDTGAEADALVTTRRALALIVRTADCAPIALAAAEGVVAVAHGGWRGLLAGVLDETAAAMRARGATRIEAALGPCIHPCCYEFGPELDDIAAVFGDGVRGRDSTGGPSLDLPATVRAAAARAGVELVYESDTCTACDVAGFWSHRASGDVERQGVLAWLN